MNDQSLSSFLATGDFTIGDSTILKNNSNKKNDEMNIIDREWMESVFMVSNKDLDKRDANVRFKTSASYKFTDTRMGGNIGINARPQYTRYSDIRSPGRLSGRTRVTVPNVAGNIGMGRWYSETIDDNSQTVYMEFGMPEFSSLMTFFTRAVDYPSSVLANTGKYPTLYLVGKAIGTIASFIAFPLLSIAVYTYKYIRTYLPGLNSYSYYWMKPHMHLYWAAVNGLVTNLAVEMGILPKIMMPKGKNAKEGNKIGLPIKFDQEYMNELKALIPDIISNNNYIDVFAIANRAQVVANRQAMIEYEEFAKNKSKVFDAEDYVVSHTDTKVENTTTSFGAYLNKIFMLGDYKTTISKDGKKVKKSKDNKDGSDVGSSAQATDTTPSETKSKEDKDLTDRPILPDSEVAKQKSKLNTFKKYFDATLRDGARFAIFKVDHIATVSESFSNSVTDIPIKDKLKSLTTKTRDIRFSTMGGNISDATSGINKMVSGAKDVLMGVLDGMTAGLSSVLSTLLEGGFIDIGKMWDDSSISLPKLSFTMQLVSPYGNPISQLQNIYIPLSMILAGVLPLSTGKASYTSPFLCSLYVKGKQNIKLGLITDVSVTRGTTNLGWNKDGRPLGIDVSFSVTDLSGLMHMPISKSVFDIFSVTNDEDGLFSNYIGTLAARDLASYKYFAPKARLTAAKRLMATEAIFSPANLAMVTGSVFEDTLGLFVPGSSLVYNKGM